MDFEDIEDEIISELKTKMSYVRTIETYAGQFELEKDIEKLPINFPAVFVVYTGSPFEWVDGPNYNETPGFSVLVASKNLRSPEALRKDPDVGAYKMVKDVLKYLTNQRFGLEAMEKLRPVHVGLVFISKTLAIYGIDFVTDFDTSY